MRFKTTDTGIVLQTSTTYEAANKTRLSEPHMRIGTTFQGDATLCRREVANLRDFCDLWLRSEGYVEEATDGA
jgi:hypothetical protein